MSENAEIFTKTILNHLVIARSNFTIGLQFWAILKNPKMASIIESHKVIIKKEGIYAIPIPPNGSMHIPENEQFYQATISGPKERTYEHASMEFAKMLLRTFVTESFELLRSYCEDFDHEEEMRQQSWYQFARITRNSLKHNQIWHFNSYDIRLLPITWNDITLVEQMNSNQMTWSEFDCFNALELWDEMYSFVRSL